MKLKVAIAAVIGALMFAAGCNDSTTRVSNHSLPSEFFIRAAAERGPEGEVVIEGSTNLPDAMKMSVEIVAKKYPRPPAAIEPYVALDADLITLAHGRFRSRGLFRRYGYDRYGYNRPEQTTRPFPPGKYEVHFTSIFNENAQTPEILALVGPGGKKLHGKMFEPQDPDVVDSDFKLDYRETIIFPPLSNEARAIALVKEAVLTVPDLGRSSADVEENIRWFMENPGIKPARGWSAKRTQGDSYTVSFDFINGEEGEQQAIWSANLATAEVRYINKHAKVFSWLPRD